MKRLLAALAWTAAAAGQREAPLRGAHPRRRALGDKPGKVAIEIVATTSGDGEDEIASAISTSSTSFPIASVATSTGSTSTGSTVGTATSTSTTSTSGASTTSASSITSNGTGKPSHRPTEWSGSRWGGSGEDGEDGKPVESNTRKPTRKPQQPTRKPSWSTSKKPTRNPTRKPAGNDDGGSEQVDEHYAAVVVGAGWSGIKAAETLLDAGINNIIVLEANNYIGGRSKTINADGSVNVANPSDVSYAPLDMGSEWLYLKGNEMEDYLRFHGLLDGIDRSDGPSYYLPVTMDTAYYLQSAEEDGTVSTERMHERHVQHLHDRIWEDFLSFRGYLLAKMGDTSYLEAKEEYVQQRANLRSDTDLQYLNLLVGLGEVDFAGDTSELSLGGMEWGDGELDPCHYMSVPGVGYGNTAATFAQPFASKILLGAKVTQINYEDTDKAIISFTKDGIKHTISANTVLVTAPLGVLKAGSIAFTPDLPDWKQKAIENQGVGVFNKCAMQWNDDSSIVWPDEEWFELITPPDEATSEKWTTFYNPTSRKGRPTLVGFIGGDDARAMESQRDEEVLDDVMTNLRAMFPGIERPDRVVISRWGREENILGTYSFKKAGEDYKDNARRLRGRVDNVFFAGEHTATSWYGTTIGAWESGERAARYMIDMLRSV